MSSITCSLRKTLPLTCFIALLAASGCVDSENADLDGLVDTDEADEIDNADDPQAEATSSLLAGPSSYMPNPSFTQTIIASGTDWNKRIVSGYALDGDGAFYSKTLYTLKNNTGIDNSPLPSSIKTDLKSALVGNRVYSVSVDIVNEIIASEAQGSLTPALQAIVEPNEPPEPQPVPGPQTIKSGFGGPASGKWFGPCESKYKTLSKPVSLSTPFSTNENLGGGFTGTLAVNGPINASATMEVKLEQKRYKIFGGCVPYAIRFDSLHAAGNASVGPTVSLDGSVSYSASWEKEIAKPSLGSIDFSIVGIPVHVPLHLPISVGYDIEATGSGSVKYNANQSATGTFDYTCTLDTCSGTASYSLSGSTAPTITGSAQARMKPNAWMQIALRAGLYDENVAYAQIGVKPYARGDLWGYLGNGCGDANGDGTNETVNALTFDLDWQAYLTAQAAAFGGTPKKWNDLWHTSPKHIGFWDLIGSSAISPMLGGPSTIAVSTPQSFTEKMRPCWPYNDAMNYQLFWGDGSGTASSGAPQTATTVSHTWNKIGTYILYLNAVSDAHGRAFKKLTKGTVQVNVPTWTPWLDRDNPDSAGDFEGLSDFLKEGQACVNPVAIECQTTTGVDWTQAGQIYSCTTSAGGVCLNANQTCKDYRVRFLCP